MKQRRGFTLIEVTVAMGVLLIISGMSIESWTKSRRAAQVEGERAKIEQQIRSIQHRSTIGYLGSSWGLRCEDNRLVTLKFIAGAPEETESMELASPVTCVTHEDIPFAKLTGRPESAIVPAVVWVQVGGADHSYVQVSAEGVIEDYAS